MPCIVCCYDIEGNPFIIRFKTKDIKKCCNNWCWNIEGNPFIIRFKTDMDNLLRQAKRQY